MKLTGRLDRHLTRRSVAVVGIGVVAVSIAMVATSQSSDSKTTPDASLAGAGTPLRTVVATEFAKVAPLDDNALGTFLEGPAFGPDGSLYFVRSTAAAGQPKILALNTRTRKTRDIHADATSVFSSVQFSPLDHKLYATDFTGAIDRMNPDGSGFETIVSGSVLGRPMVVDDMAFDRSGAIFAVDMQGTPWNPVGRIIRFDPNGKNPTLLQGGLASPNGISFDPTFSSLWVSEFTANREDSFTLAADHRAIAAGHVGMSADLGTNQLDSNAVDTAGNIYQCIEMGAEILVWNQAGKLIATIVVPQQLPKSQMLSTNLAIKPGTRDGYITVGGHNGGYIFRFTSLAPGGWQSNGGGPA